MDEFQRDKEDLAKNKPVNTMKVVDFETLEFTTTVLEPELGTHSSFPSLPFSSTLV